jgi:hypothetical protein
MRETIARIIFPEVFSEQALLAGKYKTTVETLDAFSKDLQDCRNENGSLKNIVDNKNQEIIGLNNVIKKSPFEDYLNANFKTTKFVYTKRWVLDKKLFPLPMDIRDFLTSYQTLPDFKTLEAIFTVSIRYVSDNFAYNGVMDEWQLPVETYTLGAGDCLTADTMLLGSDYEFKEISDIKIGDEIAGMGGKWTHVTNKFSKGILPILQIKLSNGCYLKCTKDHRLLLSDGKEIRASELKVGDKMLTPDTIPMGIIGGDPDLHKLRGLYVADGWVEDSRFAISGKDGHPKEKQKEWVKSLCNKYAIPFRWHEKYISINSKVFAKELSEYGRGAKNKHLLTLNYGKPALEAVLEGLNADSTYRNCRVFRTISSKLALQYRILNRMLGFSTHMRLIDKHGGLGKNPIWELNVRKKGSCFDQVIVRKIEEAGEDECYDIETENHGIYLPETDIVVHNCEDSGSLRIALARRAGIKDVFGALGFWGNEGHYFNLVWKDGSIYIVENTSNKYNPVKITDLKNTGTNYRINYVINENNIWIIDGSVNFGAKVKDEFDITQGGPKWRKKPQSTGSSRSKATRSR